MVRAVFRVITFVTIFVLVVVLAACAEGLKWGQIPFIGSDLEA